MLRKIGRRQERGSTVKGLVNHINNFKLGSDTTGLTSSRRLSDYKHVEHTYQLGAGAASWEK